MFWLILRYNQHPYPIGLSSCAAAAASNGLVSKETAIQTQQQQQRMIQSILASKNATHYPLDKLIITCPLDNCLYSASQLRSHNDQQKLQQVLKARGANAVMIHANWLSGKQAKRSALTRVGLWIVSNHPHNNNNDKVQSPPEEGSSSSSSSSLRQSQLPQHLRRNSNNSSGWVCNNQLSSPFL